MALYGNLAVKSTEAMRRIAIQKRRIQERIKGMPSRSQSEHPTLAYYVVYFTTVALLVTLCVVSTVR